MIRQLPSHFASGDGSGRLFRHGACAAPGTPTRARGRIAICVGVSLLIHVLLILITAQQHEEHAAIQAGTEQVPLVVTLNRPEQQPPAAAATPLPAPLPEPRPRPVLKPRPAPGPRSVRPKKTPPAPLIATEPVAPPVSAPEAAPPMDMMTMLNAARERRRAADVSAERVTPEPAPAPSGSSGNEIALANIQHSIQRQSGRPDGTSGVFQILSKGTRTGQFVFRGWLASARNNWRETIDVDAGQGGDVERAIVRSMIELIRKHYSGDFNWDSRRLGRVIVLSARVADNAELETFLIREFF